MFQTVYKPFPQIPVFKDSSSITAPDMSYTPREIIAKFSRGEKVPLGFNGMYDSEDDPDSLHKDDPSIFEDDPTRDPEFDFGDYVEEKHALEERLRQDKRASKAKQSAPAKRKASDEEPSASDATKRETTSEAGADAPNASPKG